MLARYRAVLQVPGSLALYLTGVIARLPQGMASLAILLLVREATRSYALAGLAVGANALAVAVAGPPQGRLVDRIGRTRVLGPCALAQSAALVALVLAAGGGLPGAVLVALAAAAGAAQPAVAPAVRALLRTRLAPGEARESAYAVESVLQELIWISGPLLVAGLVAASSPAGAVLAAAAFGLAGTALFLGSRIVRESSPAPGTAVRRGSRGPDPGIRALLLPIALMGVSIGVTDVGLPALALHAGSRASTGLLLALWSLGSMVGGLAHGARRWRLGLAARYRALLGLAVLCILPLVFARSIAAGCVGALLTGLTIAPVFACQNALVARAVPEGTETEAFTWVSAAIVVGVAVGSAVGGALVARFGVGAPFELGALALLLAATSAGRVRRLEAALA